MSRPPTPQFVETASGWSWTWKTWEGYRPPVVVVHSENDEGAAWWCRVCKDAGGNTPTNAQADADARAHQNTHLVEHEVELEWLTNDERWQVRSRYDRAGWTDVLVVHDLDDPESFDHADNLARDYAARPRGSRS